MKELRIFAMQRSLSVITKQLIRVHLCCHGAAYLGLFSFSPLYKRTIQCHDISKNFCHFLKDTMLIENLKT